MTEQELFALLQTLSIPVAYRAFEEKEKVSPPFAAFYRMNNEQTYADDIVYDTQKNMALELYTPKARNLTIEQEIETLLTENEIPFEASESYLSEEKMVEILYEFTI